MRKTPAEVLEKRKEVMDRYFKKRKKGKSVRRESDKIVEFEMARRKIKKLTPLIIDRILLDYDVRPVRESNRTYKELLNPKKLANYIHKSENREYRALLSQEEAELVYREVYGEMPEAEKVKPSAQETLEKITVSLHQKVREIAEKGKQAIPKPAY